MVFANPNKVSVLVLRILPREVLPFVAELMNGPRLPAIHRTSMKSIVVYSDCPMRSLEQLKGRQKKYILRDRLHSIALRGDQIVPETLNRVGLAMKRRGRRIESRSSTKQQKPRQDENRQLDEAAVDDPLSALLAQRERLSIELREAIIKHDVLKRKLMTQTPMITERRALVEQRREQVTAFLGQSSSIESRHATSASRYEELTTELDALKAKLASVYSQLADAAAQSLSQTPVRELPQRGGHISFLRQTISDSRRRLAEASATRQQCEAQLAALLAAERGLSETQTELSAKAQELDERKQIAMRTLAEPAESLAGEDAITADLEAAVESLAQSLHTSKQDDVAVRDDDVRALDSQNRTRRLLVSEKQKTVRQLRRAAKQRPTHIQTAPIKPRLNEARTFSTGNVESLVAETVMKMAEKQKEIERCEQEVERNQAARKEMEKRLSDQTSEISSLNDDAAERRRLEAQIDEEAASTGRATELSAELTRKAAQLRRWCDNVERDRSRNARFNSVIEQLTRRLKQKAAEIVEKESELDERRRKLDAAKAPLVQLEAKANARGEQVARVEQTTNELGAAVEQAVRRLHAEQEQLAEVLKRIPQDESDQFSGLRQLLADVTS
jgi:chromosome segregation ATPase